jgi:tetratricopeptide (TPR) repeat protein
MSGQHVGRVIHVDFAARRPATVGTYDARVTLFAPAGEHDRKALAYSLFVRASAIDEDPAHSDEAEALYDRAITLDPAFACAYANLAGVFYRRGMAWKGRAVQLWRLALDRDPRLPEAHYNLGYLALDDGDPRAAIPHFLRAIEYAPDFADAHFNVAMAYERIRDAASAGPHWGAYLTLEPNGDFADVAREYVRKWTLAAPPAKPVKGTPAKKRRAPRKKRAPATFRPYLDGIEEWVRQRIHDGSGFGS